MAKKPRKYHTLVALIDGRWGVQFGAYERGDVMAERAAYIENHEAKAKELKVITTGDTQEEISAAVAELNSKLPQYRPLTPEELSQVQAWATVEGKRWKDSLQKESWWRGIPARDKRGVSDGYELLYGLRNTHGPSWLADFKLPKGDK